jgi:DNA-binding transcriptional LysR family regulator
MRGGSIRAPATRSFRVAASDYLDPLFLPRLVARIKAEAPLCPIEILPLSPDAHYHAQLADGEADLVIGNWPEPPGDLHLGKLFADEVVCLVSSEHPAVRRGWSPGRLAAGRAHCPHAHPPRRARRDRCAPRFAWASRAISRCPLRAFRADSGDGGVSSLLVLTTGRSTASASRRACR